MHGLRSLLRSGTAPRRLFSSAAAYTAAPGGLQPIAPAVAVARAAGGGAGMPRLRLIDCGSVAAFVRAHARGAAMLPIDVATKDAARPLRVIPPALFEAVAERVGLEPGVPAVVYDDGGAIAAARVWWVLAYYGHPAAILDGGWRAYVAAGGPIGVGNDDADAAIPTAAGRVVAAPAPHLLATLDDVLAATSGGAGAAQLVDARTPAEYAGVDLRGNRFGGHCPGAVLVPHALMLAPDRTFKSPEELTTLFEARGLDPTRPVIVYCQGGMRAAVVMAALQRGGFTGGVANYDSGAEEWNNVAGLPLVTGSSPL